MLSRLSIVMLVFLVGFSISTLQAAFILPNDVTSTSYASWNGDFYPNDSNLADGWRAFDGLINQYGGWAERECWRAPAGSWVQQTFPEPYAISQIATIAFVNYFDSVRAGWGDFDLYAGNTEDDLTLVASFTMPNDDNWHVFDVPAIPGAKIWRFQSINTYRGDGNVYLAEIEMSGVPVPEPSSLLLLIGGIPLLLRRRIS